MIKGTWLEDRHKRVRALSSLTRLVVPLAKVLLLLLLLLLLVHLLLVLLPVVVLLLLAVVAVGLVLQREEDSS